MPEFDMRKLFPKRVQLLMTNLKGRSDHYKEELIASFANTRLPEFAKGTLKPIIDKEFKLSEVVEAHKFMEANGNIGKIVLVSDF